MEVDDTETGQLLQQFSSMQTQDRQDLISQMRRLVGGGETALSEAKATFYLEMANWSVPVAVGYYFDLEASTVEGPLREALPAMTFVADITVGEGESVPPNTIFTKTWTLRNSGSTSWPAGCSLRLSSGHSMGLSTASPPKIPQVTPSCTTNLTLQMTSPAEPGIYESQWRLATPTGAFFGDPIWAIVTVDPSGTMAVTQQLSDLKCQPMENHAVASAQRPTSPTDAQFCSEVNSRQVLSRMSSATTRPPGSSDTMEFDDAMD
jgi:hypothetical protein